MRPKFENGKNKADLAPINTFILFFIIPFHKIFLFFGVILECQIAASDPKYSSNLDLNWVVNAISGSNIKV